MQESKQVSLQLAELCVLYHVFKTHELDKYSQENQVRNKFLEIIFQHLNNLSWNEPTQQKLWNQASSQMAH